MTQPRRADHDKGMITAAILIGLPALIAFMLTMDDPTSKPRETDQPVADQTMTGQVPDNVIAFPQTDIHTDSTDLEETA